MHRIIEHCLCCDSTDLVRFADLGQQPAANDFAGTAAEAMRVQRFPLAVNVCRVCFHSQLTFAVDRAALFTNYAYVSGTTTTLDAHFAWLAEVVHYRFDGPGRVLDIGCNDGSQLVHFAGRGWSTFGVDPARNIEVKPEAQASVVRGFWSAEALRDLGGSFRAIVAQNVLAHTDDPLSFLKLSLAALEPGGRLYVQTSQADMVETRQFDTVYHEHLSFFSALSMKTLAERAGLRITGVWKPPVHGVSYLFEMAPLTVEAEAGVDSLIDDERARGRYSLETYGAFSTEMESRAAALRAAIAEHRSRGFAIVGYGAAAKGSTFLNYSGAQLEYIVDDAPLKQGKCVPGDGTFISSPDALTGEKRPILLVALAWNFYDEIVERTRRLRDTRHDLFLRCFPQFAICAEGTESPKPPHVDVSTTAPTYNLCIPYRDMPECLRVSLPRIIESVRRLGTVNVIIVEQTPGRRFNLGKSLNVGFELYRQGRVRGYRQFRKSDVYFFQPVDCVPADYAYCRHDPDLDFKGFTGDEPEFYKACSFTNRSYADVNGFANGFWGWGAEDHEMFLRLEIRRSRTRLVPIPFHYFNRASPDFLIGSLDDAEAVAGLIETRDVYADGLNTLRFEVVETRSTQGVQHFIVDL